MVIENSHGIGIRIVYGGAMAFVATNNMQKDNIRNLVRDAIKYAKKQ